MAVRALTTAVRTGHRSSRADQPTIWRLAPQASPWLALLCTQAVRPVSPDLAPSPMADRGAIRDTAHRYRHGLSRSHTMTCHRTPRLAAGRYDLGSHTENQRWVASCAVTPAPDTTGLSFPLGSGVRLLAVFS